MAGVAVLPPGRELTLSISSEQRHSFVVSSNSGMFVRVHLFQTDIDVAVSAQHRGRVIATADSNQFGEESLSLLQPSDGPIEIVVIAIPGLSRAGRYTVRVDYPHLPGGNDMQRIEAEKTVQRAGLLLKARTVDSGSDSLALFREALRIYTQLGDGSAELTALINLGDALYSLDRFEDALLHFNKAIDVSILHSDLRGRAEALNNRGSCLFKLGRMAEAASAFEESLRLWQQARVLHAQVSARNGLSTVRARLGETTSAIAILQRALAEADPGDGNFRAAALTNLGLQFLSVADTESAIRHLEQAVILSRKTNQRAVEARALLNLGRSYMLAGNNQMAIRNLESARKAVGESGENSLRSDILANLSQVYFRQSKWTLARTGFERALEVARKAGDTRGESARLHYLGAIKTALGDGCGALTELNAALTIRSTAGYRDAVAATLFAIADAERQCGHLHDAETYAEKGLGQLESLRSQIAGERFRALYFGGRYGYAELYIDILMQLHAAEPNSGYANKALEILERTRAGVMIESLRRADRDPKAPTSTALSTLLHERALLDEKINAALQRSGANTQQELSELGTRFDQLEIRIAEESPGLALDRPKPLTADSIIALTRPGVSFVEYVLGDERSYLWLVRPNGITTYTLPKRTDIERLVHRARDLAINQPLRHADKARDQELNDLLGKLSRMLLAPIKTRIGKDRLVVVLDDTLNDLPFEALPEPGAAPIEGRVPPAGVVHEIIRIQSASVLAALRERTSLSRPGRGIVLLGDPAFRKVAGASGDKRGDHRLFTRLPGSDDEVKQIAALYPPSQVRTFTRYAASRDTLFGAQTARASVLHIATHAIVDNSRTEYSGIALASMKDQQVVRKDGFVPLRQLATLNLSADLVVLSACATATGRHIRGEGIMDISRAFFRAGAPRVMATLWEIQDGGNTPYMMAFYQSLRQSGGFDAARAARVARESMWKSKEWRDPWFWAAFTLSGEFESRAAVRAAGLR